MAKRVGSSITRAHAPAREEQKALREFVTDFFALTGCESKRRGGVLHVTLTPELAERFGAGELCLAFQARDLSTPGVQLIQPGSVLLEKMVEHLRAGVGVACAAVPATVTAEECLPPEIPFRCSADLARVETRAEEFVTFNFRVSYVCDDKNEEIWSVTLDAEGVPVENALLLESLATAPPTGDAVETSRRTLGTLYAAAEERARAHAEESSARYEREALPRLYRELVRLRTFYQGQMSDLDPQIAEEAELRDHYERELRLRTEEEIANHRMAVSLSLINFRVVRFPIARYTLRLRAGSTRRTLTLERELAAGRLLPVCCEACAMPLAGADLCTNGHLVCSDCLHACERCGHAHCSACDTRECAHCGKQVCEECRTTCAACENVVCREETATCPVCARSVCADCLQECAVCGTRQCAAHLGTCTACGSKVCGRCRDTCAACGEHFCPDHAGTCARCGQVFCHTHLESCAVCGVRRCGGHLEHCRVCGQGLCEEHAATCPSCGATVCATHEGACAVCGAAVCAACGENCAATGKLLCAQHATRCDCCGRVSASEELATCSHCGAQACPEHTFECYNCGKVVCSHHCYECFICDVELCKACSEADSLCATCSDPEAGEEVPLEEVLALKGLDQHWKHLFPRAAWRRVTRRDGLLYYGHTRRSLMYAIADREGRVRDCGEFRWSYLAGGR